MSLPVDPFIQPLPNSLINNPDPEVASWFQYLNRFLHDLWLRTGGGIDKVAGIDDFDFFADAQRSNKLDDIAGDVDFFTPHPRAGLSSDDVDFFAQSPVTNKIQSALTGENDIFIPTPSATIKKLPGDSFTGTAYTTVGDVALDCRNTASATVTLNATPCDGEYVMIRRQNAIVTVSAPINGATSTVLLRRYDTIQLRYFASSSEWGVV